MTDRWSTPIGRVCETCGASFSVQFQSVMRPGGGMYCSRKCRPGHNAHLQKLIAHPLGAVHTVVTIACATCSSAFQTKVKNIRRGGGKYCCRECNPQYKAAQPSSVISRRSNLKSKYGLTVEQFSALVRRQGNCCAICNQPQKPHVHGGILYVDHDHSTGHVRGLLCGPCNFGLGHFRDNPSLLRSAIDYLFATAQTTKEAA